MINKQLSMLCIVRKCFLYEGRVYELLYSSKKERKSNLKMGMKHKYRVMLSSDDYDYVDATMTRRLNKFLKQEVI